MLGNGLGHLLVDREKSLAGAPVHLADELAAECVDDAGDGGGRPLADEVEIEHALHGAGLHAVDEASRLVVEESVGGERAQWPAGGSESANVVVGRQTASWVGSTIRTIGAVGGSGRHGGFCVCLAVVKMWVLLPSWNKRKRKQQEEGRREEGEGGDGGNVEGQKRRERRK